MIKTINFTDFQLGFALYKREHQFSYAGLKALFEYFEQLEEDMGRQIEFDPVAISCNYVEYDNIAEFHLEYDHEDYPDVESLYDHTQVIEIDKESFIIEAF